MLRTLRLFGVFSVFVYLAAPLGAEVRAADNKAALPTGPIDLNTATQSELESLKGVGDATAKKIIAGRPYKSVDELATKGVPQKTIDGIRPLVTAGGGARASTASTASTAAESKAASAKALAKSASSTATDMPAKTATALPGGGATGPGKGLPGSGPVDINAASETELQTLPGIGPATAKAIVIGRPYESVDDLSKVKGIGAAKINSLRGLVMASSTRKAAPAGGMVVPAAPAQNRPALPTAPARTAAPAAATPPPTMPAMPSTPPAKMNMPANTPTSMPAAPAPAAAAARTGTAAAATAAALAPGQKVNINTASATELEALPGIGPAKAQKIIAGRPYSKPEDIMKVSGIKEGVYSKVKDSITVQ